MTFPWAPPSVSEVVVAWLRLLGDPNGVGTDRPSGSVLPYRMVTPVAGTEQYKIIQRAVVSVHTFGADMDTAEAAAQITHQWMLQMGPPIAGPQKIVISNSRIVVPSAVDTEMIPTWIDYQDNTIRRFVARYNVDLRFTNGTEIASSPTPPQVAGRTYVASDGSFHYLGPTSDTHIAPA